MFFIHSKVKRNLGFKILLGLLSCSSIYSIASDLTLEKTIQLAQQNDLWLVGNQHSEDALQSMSIAASTLPDPKVSISLANLAADSFDFNQEAMSQFKVGISQQFPRGDSLAIRQRQFELQGSQFPYQRQDRKAKVAVTVATLWLDTYKAQESIALIEANRALFEQLADVAEARYSSAVGKTRQQDIVRAQLELTRLEDRLTMLEQRQAMSKQQLSQWISSFFIEQTLSKYSDNNVKLSANVQLAKQLPNIALINPKLYVENSDIQPQLLVQYFSQHPSIKALEQKIKASDQGIELAKQKYKPQWGVNASYGYRDDTPLGNNRADLLSIGVSFDMPFFTDNRQDKEVQSAVSKTNAVKTNKWLLLRRMFTAFESSKAQLLRIQKRQHLYQTKLLPQIHQQAEASLTAYTNDDGDFAEVVRARISVLNAEIDKLGINVDQQKTVIQLNYYFENENSSNVLGEVK